MKETTYYAVTKIHDNGESREVIQHLNVHETKDKAKAEAAKLRKGRSKELKGDGYSFVVTTLHGKEGFEVVKQLRYDELRRSILQEAKSAGPEVSAFAHELLNSFNLTYEELYCCNFDNAVIETSAEEYISRTTSASVWTHYVEGWIHLNGIDYVIGKTPYSSTANRV